MLGMRPDHGRGESVSSADVDGDWPRAVRAHVRPTYESTAMTLLFAQPSALASGLLFMHARLRDGTGAP